MCLKQLLKSTYPATEHLPIGSSAIEGREAAKNTDNHADHVLRCIQESRAASCPGTALPKHLD